MTSENIEFVRYLSNLSVIAPFLTGLIKFRLMPIENRIILLVVGISAVSDFFGYMLSASGGNTALLFNLYCVVCFILTSWYFYEVVFKFRSRVYFVSGLIVYILSIIFSIVTFGIESYHGTLWAVTGLILVIFGIIYNNYQVEKPPLLDRNLYSGLIFNAAIILYFSFNFFLFIIANYVLTELSPETGRMAWAFHNVNNIIKNIAFAFGFYYTNRRRLDLTDEEVERIQWRHLH